MPALELIATATFGLEAVVARELKQLGYEQQTVADGRIAFPGDKTAVCRTNVWLRSADRVLLKLGEFEARDFGELFDRTIELPWSDWLPANAAFPVRGKSVRSQLHSVPDCQAIVKKAVVENLKRAHRREWFEETGPLFGIEVSLVCDRVTLSIDTSGPGLHKRGYRKLTGPSPLKETLAAGLIQLSYWNRERPLLDPFCGTGTIPIEAALIGRNIAPGLEREFAAEKWPGIPRPLWDNARTEARDSIAPALRHPLVGTDRDEKVLGLARHHARNAGVEQDVRFEQRSFSELETDDEYGCLICNPPYGERSGELPELEELYREMGRTFSRLPTWSIYVLTSHARFESLARRRADRRRKLYNGGIECTYYQFLGPKPPKAQNAGERPA